MRLSVLLLGLFAAGMAAAQAPATSSLSYNYAELRFVDVDVAGGDGLRLNGSVQVAPNWIVVGGLTDLDFNNDREVTTFEIGGGYVYPFRSDFDLVGTARFVHTEVDEPGNDFDDNGLALAGGLRGLVAPQFEVRGSVNYVNLEDSDTFLELAGDYYFTRQFVAGLSLEFAGDADVITVGARWFFRYRARNPCLAPPGCFSTPCRLLMPQFGAPRSARRRAEQARVISRPCVRRRAWPPPGASPVNARPPPAVPRPPPDSPDAAFSRSCPRSTAGSTSRSG